MEEREATPTLSMSALEYIQQVPLTHIHQQRQVNKHLWERWNLADHHRSLRLVPFCETDTKIVSAGAKLINGEPPCPMDGPPVLTLLNSVSMKHWLRVQESAMNAHMGEIFFVYDGTPKWKPADVRISWATQRVDTPLRWKHYCVHHLPSESFLDVIRSY